MKKIEYLIDEDNRLSVCDLAADAVYEYTRGLISDNKECLRYRVAVEDCLLKWLDESSVGHRLTLIFKKPFVGSPFIELRFDGKKLNPLDKIDDEYEYSTRVALGLTPLYVYRKKENVVRFELKGVNTSSPKKLAKVLLLSIIVGYAGVLFVPEYILSAIVTYLLTPINNTFLNLLNCIACPMVFLSVSMGIYGIGDTSTLSKIGSRMIKIFIRNDFAAGIMCVFLFPLCGLTISANSSGSAKLSNLFRMILDIVPNNIIEPFSNGNTLQVIFLSFCVGFALLFLGKKTSAIVSAVNQMNYLLQFFMEIIGGLVPYFVFVVIVSLFWSGNISMLATTWKFYAYLLCGVVAFSALLLCFVAYKNKIRVTSLLKKILPSFLIAITTASSAASFSSNVEICRKKLGIDDSVTHFGIPLGMVIHSPIFVINIIVVSFYFASLAEVECSLSWLISAIFVSTVLAIASPPIPGGGAIIYATLFMQLGISDDFLPLAFAIDILSDFIVTAFEMLCLTPSLLDVSTCVDLTNEKILHQ